MRRTCWTAGAAVAAACSGEPELASAPAPISGGTTDAIDVAVVGIVDDASGGTCTGSLIAPDLVVTAQHCVAQPVGIGPCDQGTFGAPRAAAGFFVTTRPTLTFNPGDYHPVAEVVIPPGAGFCGRDIALLRLTARVPAAEAAPIAPRLTPAVAAAEPYAAVGYGSTDDIGTGSGERRRRDGLAVTCVGAACASSFTGDAEWVGETGICAGDSGGPALDAAGRVIGVVSRGAVGCTAPTYVAIAAHADWLTAQAIRAATLGGYPPPSWTGAVPAVDAGVDGPLPDAAPAADAALDAAPPRSDGGGCRTGPGGAASGAALLVLALGALARVRGSVRMRLASR